MSPIQGLLGAGECFVDEVEVRVDGRANQVSNGGFDAGAHGWVFEGNHDLSSVAAGIGRGGTPGLFLRAVRCSPAGTRR